MKRRIGHDIAVVEIGLAVPDAARRVQRPGRLAL